MGTTDVTFVVEATVRTTVREAYDNTSTKLSDLERYKKEAVQKAGNLLTTALQGSGRTIHDVQCVETKIVDRPSR